MLFLSIPFLDFLQASQIAHLIRDYTHIIVDKQRRCSQLPGQASAGPHMPPAALHTRANGRDPTGRDSAPKPPTYRYPAIKPLTCRNPAPNMQRSKPPTCRDPSPLQEENLPPSPLQEENLPSSPLQEENLPPSSLQE